jgi:LysR substrate binding domain
MQVSVPECAVAMPRAMARPSPLLSVRREACLRAGEAVEDTFPVGPGDARPGVGDLDPDAGVLGGGMDGDLAAVGGGVAHVAEEVVQDLPDALRIAVQVGVAADARASRSPQVAAEVSAADEKFEIVSSGEAITLLAEGNADFYSREGIACIPVNGLEPARLAIARRRCDHRPAVRDFIQACREAADTQKTGTYR